MSLERALRNTTCSKGHTHPPWNTTGVLRIAKCESVCGFCQKETKTAANLRKHVAIHIKNERLDLSIAEGSSGRGRLEMPIDRSEISVSSSSGNILVHDEESKDVDFSSSKILTAMARGHPFQPTSDYSRSNATDFGLSTAVPTVKQPQPSHSQQHSRAGTSSPPTSLCITSQRSNDANITTRSHSPSPTHYQYNQIESHDVDGSIHVINRYPLKPRLSDPYTHLRNHNIPIKTAWTVIPASEGFRILDLCKSMSTASLAAEGQVPCYNRETLFDEEWQSHMKDVHGVFLLWPETWMRRIEVLDLDAFGGDIGACNEVIMAS